MNRKDRREFQNKIKGAKKLLKESSRTRKRPHDIPCADEEENLYYRIDISQAGYSFVADWSSLLKDQYDLPQGVEVWGKGKTFYMFVPKGGKDGEYGYGGKITEV